MIERVGRRRMGLLREGKAERRKLVRWVRSLRGDDGLEFKFECGRDSNGLNGHWMELYCDGIALAVYGLCTECVYGTCTWDRWDEQDAMHIMI